MSRYYNLVQCFTAKLSDVTLVPCVRGRYLPVPMGSYVRDGDSRPLIIRARRLLLVREQVCVSDKPYRATRLPPLLAFSCRL